MRWSAHALVALATGAAACGYDITTQDLPSGVTVATYRAQGADFSTYATFAIVSEPGLVTNDLTASGKAKAPGLMALITSRLEARGFQKVGEIDPTQPLSTPALADLAVNVTALEADKTDAAYWLGYAGHAAPASWGYAGYGWSYPWDWVPVSFATGTLLIEIADLKNAPAGSSTNPALRVMWTSASHRASIEPGVYDTNQVFESVNRAFDQSPYLATH